MICEAITHSHLAGLKSDVLRKLRADMPVRRPTFRTSLSIYGGHLHRAPKTNRLGQTWANFAQRFKYMKFDFSE